MTLLYIMDSIGNQENKVNVNCGVLNQKYLNTKKASLKLAYNVNSEIWSILYDHLGHSQSTKLWEVDSNEEF